jgi:hypothetical protein
MVATVSRPVMISQRPAGAEQRRQVSVQALSQQTPSAQKPDRQVRASVQTPPLAARIWQVPRRQ